MDTVFPRIIAVPRIIAPLDGNFFKKSLPLNNRPPPPPPNPYGLLPFFIHSLPS